jgi:hypothetical protein
MNVGLHPHVSGRAYRIRALREFIRYAKSLPGVWWTTREEVASWYLKNHESHIPTGGAAGGSSAQAGKSRTRMKSVKTQRARASRRSAGK